MSTIQTAWSERMGSDSQKARRFRDFVVDGARLSSHVGDFIPLFGWAPRAEQNHAVDRLLARAPADLPSGRVSLYVCPECGDLGCGAIGVFVEKTADGFLWRDVAHENNYDGLVHSAEYAALGPFVFAEAEYIEVLDRLRSEAACNAG